MISRNDGHGTRGTRCGIVLAALILAGCGAGTPSGGEVPSAVAAGSHPAAGASGGPWGPWQAEPMPVGAATQAAVDRACREPVGDRPEPMIGPTFRLAVVDARGEGILQAMFIQPGGQTASCEDIELAADGSVTWPGMASRDDTPQPTLGPFDFRSAGGSSVGSPPGSNSGAIRSISYGAAGPGIASIIVDVPGPGRATASLANGAWVVWWPGAWPPGSRITALNAAGISVAEELYP